MNTRAIQHLQQKLNVQGANIMPVWGTRGKPTAQTLHKYISPITFQRISHDIRMWREAQMQAEMAIYPQRIKLNRMYMDTVENPDIKALLTRRNELVLQRDWMVYQDKGGKKVVSEVLTQQLENQYWFNDYLQLILEAWDYGYTWIELGDIEDDKFPFISGIQRENIRVDGTRLPDKGEINPALVSIIYALQGINLNDSPEIAMCNHFVSTRSNRGQSICGMGLLLNLSLLEIFMRHALSWNMDYIEMYGQPIRKGSTDRAKKEDLDEFESMLDRMGSNAYIMLDKNKGDELELVRDAAAGTGWKSYDNFMTRVEKTASQLVLGHSDAITSSPGKLGGMQAANKDGYNESLVEQAVNSKQTTISDFVCRYVNEHGAHKFRWLGNYAGSNLIKNLFPSDKYKFGLKNDKEEQEIRRRRNSANVIESGTLLNLANAGYKVPAEDASAYMDLPLTDSIPTKELIQERENINIDGEKPTHLGSPGENTNKPVV